MDESMSFLPQGSTEFERGTLLGRIPGGLALIFFLAPALGALAWFPNFVTQDGPAHLYNARILNASLRPDSPFGGTFEVAWSPLPNWAGHLLTMVLVGRVRPDIAGRLITAFTLVALAGSIVWLRWVVKGSRGLATTALLAVILSLNVTWLLGFTSFLLGSALLPLTLGVWWGGRERFGPIRALVISVLLVLGYFCHPISLALTVAGLVLLAVGTPALDWPRRAAWTIVSLLPLAPLGLSYLALTRSAGGMAPSWQFLTIPGSLLSWKNQIGWIDPITLASRSCLPFVEGGSPGFWIMAPALWVLVALGILVGPSWKQGRSDHRGWLILAAILLVGGLFGPDSLGIKHGHYLPQRVALLGVIALVPWLEFEANRRVGRVALGLLLGAWGMQSLFVWDYGADCQKVVGEIAQAGPSIGDRHRVGTLMVGIKRRFRSNPLLHADCLLGLQADNVIWNNYETSHYYFPVKVRPGLESPPALDFEHIVLLDAPDEMDERVERWKLLLAEYSRSIDVIMVWSESPIPRLDAVNAANGYREIFHDGSIRVWSRSEEVASRPKGHQ